MSRFRKTKSFGKCIEELMKGSGKKLSRVEHKWCCGSLVGAKRCGDLWKTYAVVVIIAERTFHPANRASNTGDNRRLLLHGADGCERALAKPFL